MAVLTYSQTTAANQIVAAYDNTDIGLLQII